MNNFTIKKLKQLNIINNKNNIITIKKNNNVSNVSNVNNDKYIINNNKYTIDIYRLYNNIYNININIYRLYNKELKNYSDNELIEHYNNYGIYEDRIYNIKSFNNKYNLNLLNEGDIILFYENIKNKKTIYIYAPKQNENCGGIIALYNLYNKLKINNIFNTQIILFLHNDRQKILHHKINIDDYDIVIYPEIIYGNPLKGKNIIRWILLGLDIETPKDIIKTWNNSDLIYHWLPMDKKLTKYNQLYMPFFNRKYYNKNMLRNNKTCYLFKKGIFCNLVDKNKINLIERNNMNLILDNITLDEKIHVFNTYKFFYTFDPITAYIPYALLCGCIPIVEPYKNYTKEEYVKNFTSSQLYSFSHGFAYGNTPEEIEFAIKTKNIGISEAINMLSDEICNYNFDKFVNQIDNYYNKNINTINNNIFNLI